MELLPEPGFSRIREYCSIFKISPPTYYRGAKKGTHPKSVFISDGLTRIPNSVINQRIKRVMKLQEDADKEVKAS